jgi:hypothetical protein
MTKSPRELLEDARRGLDTGNGSAIAAALDGLTALVKAEERRLAGFRARRIPEEQRDAEAKRVAARQAAYQSLHGGRATLRGAVRHIASAENMPRSRVRSYLEALKK